MIEIKGDPLVIGRLQECQVILDSTGVSRKHAEIRRAGDRFTLVDLHSRNLTFLNGRKVEPDDAPAGPRPNDRIKICDVEFVFFPTLPKEPPRRKAHPVGRDPGHRGGLEELSGALHTLDASRSSSMASAVRPEVKLKAILEISRRLSSDLKIDTVAPNIIDALMELFPQSERGFLILIDPADQAADPQGVQVPAEQADLADRALHRRGADEHQPVDRQPVIGQKKAVLPGRRGRPGPAHQRLDRRPEDPLGHVRAPAGLRRRGPGDHPARHQQPPPVPPGRPGHPHHRGRPGGRRGAERLDAREAAAQRLARARPEHRRDGAEAVPAPVGPQDPRLRVLRLLPADLRGRRRLLRLHPPAGQPAGDRAGRRGGQGGLGGPDDGQVLGRHPVLRLDRALAAGGDRQAEQRCSAPRRSTRSS